MEEEDWGGLGRRSLILIGGRKVVQRRGQSEETQEVGMPIQGRTVGDRDTWSRGPSPQAQLGKPWVGSPVSLYAHQFPFSLSLVGRDWGS